MILLASYKHYKIICINLERIIKLIFTETKYRITYLLFRVTETRELVILHKISIKLNNTRVLTEREMNNNLEQYGKLLDFLLSFLFYYDTFVKYGIILKNILK